MRRPLLIASAVLLCLHVLWLVQVHLIQKRGRAIDYMIMTAILLCAFGVTTFSRNRRFVAGLLVAVPASVLAVFAHVARQLLGDSVDFPGVSGALNGLVLSLLFSFVLATIGANLACVWACLRSRLSLHAAPGAATSPRARGRFASLIQFGLTGVAVGVIGQVLTSSRAGYIAVPICLAVGWCVASDPSFWVTRRSEP